MSAPETVDLEHVFAFGYKWGECNPEAMARLQQALQEGAAQVTVVALPTCAYDLDLWRQFSASAGHRELCARAAAWLTAQGHTWTAYRRDLAYCGGCADVATTDQRIMVECGYTQTGKVLCALAQGRMVLVAPEGATAYLFTPSDQARLQEIAVVPDKFSAKIASRLGLN